MQLLLKCTIENLSAFRQFPTTRFSNSCKQCIPRASVENVQYIKRPPGECSAEKHQAKRYHTEEKADCSFARFPGKIESVLFFG